MREKAQVLDEFWIRAIALLTMTFDHVGLFLMNYNASSTAAYTTGFVFRIIGRLAFPLFAFMLAEGLRHTHNRTRYILRLFYMWLFIAIIDVILYSVYRSGASNWLANLGAGLAEQAFTDLLLFALFIYLLEHPKKKLRFLAILPLAYIIASYVCSIVDRYGYVTYEVFPYFLRSGYSVFGFLVFLGFYYSYSLADTFLKKNQEALPLPLEEYQKTPQYRSLVNTLGISFFVVITIIFWGLSYIDLRIDPYETEALHIQNYCLLDAFILILYNGKRGYDSKGWRLTNYLYYPVHLAIIGLIFSLI